MNHGMWRTFSVNSFFFWNTEQHHSEAEGHRTFKCTFAEPSTVNVGHVWFHMTNKSCPHFPNNSTVLPNRMSFDESYCPFAENWLPVGLLGFFRTRSCFLCSHPLWLHLTDVLLKLFHSSMGTHWRKDTDWPSVLSLSTLSPALGGRGQLLATQATGTIKPWVLGTSLLSQTLFTELRTGAKGNETHQWNYQSPKSLEDFSHQSVCVCKAPVQCVYSTSVTENSAGSETFIMGLLHWLSRCLHSFILVGKEDYSISREFSEDRVPCLRLQGEKKNPVRVHSLQFKVKTIRYYIQHLANIILKWKLGVD